MGPLARLIDPELLTRLDQLALSARSVVAGVNIGLHRSPVRGASVEFRQHRAYTRGDEIRRLDWRVLGRTDRTYIREFDEETDLRAMLMLDCSGSMSYGRGTARKFDHAVRLCAAVAYVLLSRSESVGLAQCDKRVRQWLDPQSGPKQMAAMIDLLERAAPTRPGSLDVSAGEVARRLRRRSLVMIVSDLLSPFDAVRAAMIHLRHRKHEVILARVLHEDEIEFPFRNWHRFRGLEGESPAICEPAVMRDAYLREFAEHDRQIAETARSLGADYLTLRSGGDLFEAVSDIVRRRQAS